MKGELTLLLKALAFAARKHRDQRRKDAQASPYINHPIALADVLVNEAGVTDVEVDKICNLRDVATDPPAQWDRARRREYFDWAKSVVDRLRGADSGLEAVFDRAYSQRPD
jgi:(p)ppGpp synthase/HD superfamily hydrolase